LEDIESSHASLKIKKLAPAFNSKTTLRLLFPLSGNICQNVKNKKNLLTDIVPAPKVILSHL